MDSPDVTLVELMRELGGGWVPSRKVTEAALDAGLTPWDVRAARLRLGIVVKRRGRRDTHTSLWALPDDLQRTDPGGGAT